MSDTWLVIFPSEPTWVPNAEQETRAAEVIARLVPTAVSGQPDLVRTTNIEFIDAGANFEAIRCPLCGRELDVGWWQDQMSRQHSTHNGFRLEPFAAPCCGGATKLNALTYEWPLGFARWSARVLYPDRSWLTEPELGEIAAVLGQAVRQTFRHI